VEVRVGRPENPLDPEAGAVQRLAWQLRRLREKAGRPGYRALAQRAHYSASTLAEAAKGDRLASLAVTLAYVEACGGDRAEWRARWEAVAAEVDTAAAAEPTPDEERCPYQGLTPFQSEQAEWFFGRSRLVGRLLERVERLPLVGVFGASGSGKSSLLRAGLLGTIAEGRQPEGPWRTMLLTPTEHPLDALSDQVAKLSGQDVHRMREELRSDPAALDIAIRGALVAGPPETRALLVVDQFEELFTLCADQGERRRFIAALLDAAHGPDRRTTVVLGVRADFLAQFAQHPDLLDALGEEAKLLVGPVSATELREIVIRPAAQMGWGVEPDMLATVLADAAEEPGALPLVSHALLETWHRRKGATLTLSAYQASGGVRGAIAQTADRVYSELTAEQQQAARRIFLRLSALGDGTGDSRRPIARVELDGVLEEAGAAEILGRLAEARLVVIGRDTVEMAHEALIRAWPRLHRWLTDDRANLIIHRRLTEAAHAWKSLDQDAGALYRGAQLLAACDWARDHPRELNQLEDTFLRTSSAQETAEQDSARRHARLLKRLIAGISVLLVLAVLGGGVAAWQRQDARRLQLDALSGELSLQARSLLATDPDLAGLLAVEADHLHPNAATRGSILSAAAAPRRTELNIGGPAVYTVTFSPDHTLLASSNGDGTIGLWDPVRGTRIAFLRGHTGRPMKVAFSGDGKRLASTAVDGTSGSLIVWDVRTRRPMTRLAEDRIGPGMALSTDGTKIAIGVGDGDIALHDLSTGSRRLLRGQGHGPAVGSLSFSHDGELLVSADETRDPVVWAVKTGRPIASLPSEHVAQVAFASSGRMLAAAADDRGVYLWNLDRERPTALPRLPLPDSFGWAISAPVGGRLAVADENGTVTIWDLRRRAPVHTYQDRGRTETVSVALSRDGAMLASAGFNGTIVLHDLRNAPFSGFDAQIKDVKVSPDGNVIATAGSDRTVRLWDTRGEQLTTLSGHPDQVQAVAFSSDGRLLASVTRNNIVTIWDVRRRRHAAEPVPTLGVGASTDIAFAPRGRRLLAAATLGLFVWDVHDLTSPPRKTSKYQPRLATSLVFTPDGRRLVAASTGGFLNAWDVATGKPLARDKTGQGAVQDVAVSPDGKLLATAGDSRTVKLWSATDHRELAVLSGHTAPVQVIAFSRDGRTLASAGDDHSIIVWDIATRRSLATLNGHGARIRGLAFTPDGALVSGGEDGRVIRWPLDLHDVKDRLCAAAGRGLTRQEWATYLPSVPYQPTCRLRSRR
jgi:WD40 repeat protein